jgi:zinc transport system substrate-binding protein
MILMRILATLVLAATLTGCAAFTDEAPGSADGVQVATAFYPLQYVAQRVAGDLATVVNLTQPGSEPHDLELTVAETAAIADADLVIHAADFQPGVDEAIAQNGTGEAIDAAAIVGLEPFDEVGHEHPTEDQAVEESGEDHEHGDLDPHFWQDPLRMADLGDAVAVELGATDPAHADAYGANAAALRADLESLDESYDQGLAGCGRSTVVVSHDAFGYLEKYGLEMEPIAGLSPDAEPTPADLARLQDLIRREGLTTVFSERLVSPRLSRTLADDLGITTAVLDPVEGLSDETADEDYLSLMRENLRALERANGCS